MVDFALVLELDGKCASDSDKQALKAIQRTVWSQPGDMESVNQTLYLPLQLRPIAVSIETKVSGSIEKGKVQLGIWIAAWHHRMNFFLDSHVNRSNGRERRVVTMPLLLIFNNEWKLLFACDRGDRLEILEDMSIGGTKRFIDSYTLLAVLREIAHYVESTFKDWIVDVFTPDSSPRTG